MAITNAEFIKKLVDINDQYAVEHPNEEKLLKPQTEAYLKEILKQGELHGNDPAITNLLFNNGLKAKPIQK